MFNSLAFHGHLQKYLMSLQINNFIILDVYRNFWNIFGMIFILMYACTVHIQM